MKTPEPTDTLRVYVHDSDIGELVERFPMLSRTEITDIVTARGPMRRAVEAELERRSALKR